MEPEEKTPKNEEEVRWNCWLRTIFAGTGAMVVTIFLGIHEAQSAVMLPQLRKADSIIHVSPAEETWIASLGIIMAPVSSLIAGPLIDAFGRKKGLQFFYFNTFVGYGVLFFAQNIYHIYIGRFISGMGTGLIACSVIYLVEICTKRQREIIFLMVTPTVPLGVLLMSIIGGYLSWPIASLIFSLAAGVLFVMQCFIPESPPWLLKRGKEASSIRSLRALGRTESAIQQEIDTMRILCKDDTRKVDFRTFLAPTVWKPFVIIVAFFFLQAATGVHDLMFYSVDFIERLGTGYDALNLAIMLSITRFLSCCTIVVYLRSRVGRRFSIICSSALMVIALSGMTAYEYIQRDVSVLDRPFRYLIVVFLILHMVAGVIGMLNLPWLMSGEVYPLRVRGVMAGASHAIGNVCLFLVARTYFLRLNALDMHGLLLVFSAFCIVVLFFGIYVLPETCNKSLHEIEQGFLPKKERQLKRVSDFPLLRKHGERPLIRPQ